MKQSQVNISNPFMECERLILEVSGSGTSRVQFLQAISNQIQKLSGCDALELRSVDNELHYRWFTRFEKKADFTEVEFLSDEKIGLLPVLQPLTGMEEICNDLFRLRFEPVLQYEYSLSNRYIEDTSVKITLSTNRKVVSNLDKETGFSSILLLPFTLQGNPPGLLILYSRQKRFLALEDIPAYENLMHTFSIALKFRRSLYALNERIKELTCLYGINQVYENYTEEPEVILQGIMQLIPQAFQYPCMASACAKIGDTEYSSDNLSVSANYLSSRILIENNVIGFLKVYYPEMADNTERLHFLPEEQKLLDIISQKIAMLSEKSANKQEKQAIEEQLRHADRLATIGQLASGIAHELNDPLANILGYAQLLLKTKVDESQKADLERIVRSSLHSREIVRKLLMFARQMPTQKHKIQLNKVVTDTLDLLKSRVEQSKVKLTLNLLPELPMLTADQSQMTQLVTNLSVNALQAMQGGGKLHISTAIKENTIVLEITDTGSGIRESELDKIFLPFYTTKPVGVGTGLGLSVVHGIVASHNGTIRVQSKDGKGSRFIVVLPLAGQNEK